MRDLVRLPLLPLRDPDLVVFPELFCEIDVGRAISLEAIRFAKKSKSNLIICNQKDPLINNLTLTSFYNNCIEIELKNEFPLNKEMTSIRIIVVGVKRGILKTITTSDDGLFLFGEMKVVNEPIIKIDDEIKNLVKNVKEIITEKFKYINIENKEISNQKDLSSFSDYIAGQLQIVGKKKIKILGCYNPKERLELLLKELTDVSNLEKVDLSSRPEEDEESTINEYKRLKIKVEKSGMPKNVMKTVNGELRRLSMISPANSEFQVTFNYIDRLASLPWDKTTEDKLDIEEATKILDEDHYGLEKAKERILEFLAVRKLRADHKGSILCFAGPPGVGKTSSGKSIARAMGRKFIRMSLGGIGDEAEIRGHRRTYVGAIPGRIMDNIQKAEVKNPVFMLDEIDKLCSSFRGDPASALLEVLDPEQNNTFVDNYFSVPFDLSQVMFICTVNDISTIPSALRDRLEIIELSGYSTFDKVKIAQGYLIPKQRKENGLEDKDSTISVEALTKIIEEYTSEAGVRSLERSCGTIMRKLAVIVVANKEIPNIVEINKIEKYLGPPKIFAEKAWNKSEIGLSTGLAYTSYGGNILFIESVITPGEGKIVLTGNLGNVIKESCEAALTWIRSNAERFYLTLEKINKSNIHVHFPAGATPKEGPSAGVAIVVSMLSALTERPVRNDIAMTGEISLRGRVLPIGGLKEKILAANRAGIKKVLFPEKNICDLEEVPKDVQNEMEFVRLYTVIDAIDILLEQTDQKQLIN